MTFSPGSNLYTQGYGSRPENVEVPVIQTRDPGPQDSNYPIGKRWINTAVGTYWVLVNILVVNGINSANWATVAGAAGVTTMSGENGTHSTSSSGNFNFSGTPAGGSGSRGAIVFSTVNPGEVNAQVQVDQTTIAINGNNQLVALMPESSTASAEGGAHIPANAGNFNYSGSVAGGSTANGAILFSTVSPGKINAAVQVDGTSITISGSNKLVASASVPTTISAEGGTPIPANSGNFNIAGSIAGGSTVNGGIQFTTVSPGEVNAEVLVDGSSITINGANQLVASSQRTPLLDLLGSGTVASNTAYYCEGANTATLPAAPANGDQVTLFSGGFPVIVKANTGQQIQLQNGFSTRGGTATGTVAAGTCLVLAYYSGSATWIGISQTGTWTLA